MKLNNELKRMRERAGLTQEQLAAALNIGASTLRVYENGKRVPPADVIVAICRYFSVSSDWLLDLSYEQKGVQPLSVPEELRAPAEELIGSVLKVCEIESGRRFNREGLPILRQIVEIYGFTLAEIDEKFTELVQQAPDFEGQAVPGSMDPELQRKLFDQIAKGQEVDPDLRERAQLSLEYQDDVSDLINSSAIQIDALIRRKLLAQSAQKKRTNRR